MRFFRRSLVAVIGAVALVAAGCGDDAEPVAQTDTVAPAETAAPVETTTERPTVVVTTNILGDVVENLVGDAFDVVTIMPVGSDPHDFQASAQQVAAIGQADVLIVNGAAFEEGLIDVIEAAEEDGVPVLEAISAVEPIEFGEGGHDDHADEDHAEDHDDDDDHDDHADEDHEDHADEDDHDHDDEDHADEDHADEDHADEDHDDHADEDDHADDDHADDDDHDDHADEDDHGHDHEGVDPHFFTDTARMAHAAEAIVEFLATNVDGVDGDALRANAQDYIDELVALDAEIADLLAAIPDERRVLVTNHEVFGYFAERYDFEVVGTIIPGGSTLDGTSARELAELAEVIEHEGVPAIFADISSSDQLAQTLAAEVGDIQVVALFSESLGDADSEGATYIDMARTNAQRIVDALTG
ncbi:metal ABC transporter solute-binding protein, Zn/Mn family [Candidatus Poriferisocius sp.]|uniref:metal ABC transporter solute-binding protein, Zn/Mn family n=1 Tax=Candidatus Poriferisocius sp. TaxID=3101276 RepID=UPI003B59E409